MILTHLFNGHQCFQCLLTVSFASWNMFNLDHASPYFFLICNLYLLNGSITDPLILTNLNPWNQYKNMIFKYSWPLSTKAISKRERLLMFWVGPQSFRHVFIVQDSSRNDHHHWSMTESLLFVHLHICID